MQFTHSAFVGLNRFRKFAPCVLFFAFLLSPISALFSQNLPAPSARPRYGSSVDDLLREAESNNPDIRASQQVLEGAKRTAAQITNGQIRSLADSEIELANANYDGIRRAIRAELKESYFQLAYLFDSLRTLETEGQLLQRLEQAADARYRTGLGNQQDLLRAQLEQTKYLAEFNHHDLEAAKLQNHLKQILNRSPSFSEVTPYTLTETDIQPSYYELWAATRASNPDLMAAERVSETQKLRAKIARKGLYSYFDVQYGRDSAVPTRLGASYIQTFEAPSNLGSEGGTGRQPAETQAEAELLRSQSESEAESLAVAAELNNQYAIAQRTKDLLRIYREGLLPQSQTLTESLLAAYQNNRSDFSEVLSALLENSRLNSEYWRILADHESAVGRIEEITGVSLRVPQNIPVAK